MEANKPRRHTTTFDTTHDTTTSGRHRRRGRQLARFFAVQMKEERQ
jgi:hypothetical protein